MWVNWKKQFLWNIILKSQINENALDTCSFLRQLFFNPKLFFTCPFDFFVRSYIHLSRSDCFQLGDVIVLFSFTGVIVPIRYPVTVKILFLF